MHPSRNVEFAGLSSFQFFGRETVSNETHDPSCDSLQMVEVATLRVISFAWLMDLLATKVDRTVPCFHLSLGRRNSVAA